MTLPVTLIEPYCPFPTDSGGKTRIKHTIKFLGQKLSLNLLTFYHHPDELIQSQDFLRQYSTTHQSYPVNHKYFFSFITRFLPYWFSDWYGQKLISDLKSLPATPTYVIETTQLLYLVDHLPSSSKKVFVAHDISTISFWRRLLEERRPLKIILHFLRFLEVFIYEFYYLHKCSTVVTVTEKDSDFLKKYFFLKNLIVSNNGVESIDFPTRRRHQTVTIGYLGSTNHGPNRQAIQFLTQHMYPLVKNSPIRIVLGGSSPNLSLPEDITQLGYVPITADFFKKIDILVAPIFSGSGSRLKVLESLSFACPVITTPIGAEGLNINSPLLTIIPNQKATSPKEWLKAIKHQPKPSTKDLVQLQATLQPYLWRNSLVQLLNTIAVQN